MTHLRAPSLQGWSGISSPLPWKKYSSGWYHTRDTRLLAGFCTLVRGHRKAAHGAQWPLRAFLWSPCTSQTYKDKAVCFCLQISVSPHLALPGDLSQEAATGTPLQFHCANAAKRWHHPPTPAQNSMSELPWGSVNSRKGIGCLSITPSTEWNLLAKTRASRRAAEKYRRRAWVPQKWISCLKRCQTNSRMAERT